LFVVDENLAPNAGAAEVCVQNWPSPKRPPTPLLDSPLKELYTGIVFTATHVQIERAAVSKDAAIRSQISSRTTPAWQ
jgi:hypothetical protein